MSQELPSVEILRVEPEDTIVVTLDEMPKRILQDDWEERMQEQFPNNMIIFCVGATISVVRPSKGKKLDIPEEPQKVHETLDR